MSHGFFGSRRNMFTADIKEVLDLLDDLWLRSISTVSVYLEASFYQLFMTSDVA